MPSVTREIFIAVPPEIVRRHVHDPDRRRGWLDDEVTDHAPDPDGDLTYTREDGADTSHVRIEILPEDDGTRVRVTEELEEPADGEDVVSLASHRMGPPDRPPGRAVAEEEQPRILVRAA